MAVADPRWTDLYVSARTFLAQHDLHPDPDTYLAHGYVDLCLRAWPAAGGAPLHLATHWALWTWATDDVFDAELRNASPREIALLVAQLSDVIDEVGQTQPGDHPAVRALADLTQRTRGTMPDYWWDRYRTSLEAWLHAAADKLVTYLQPGRTPTLREYEALRPVDGGMMLAAMWTELATQCVSPDWSHLRVRSLLASFSAVGTLVNDLAADKGDTFNALAALVRTTGLPTHAAREHVQEQLEAEERRLWWLLAGLQDFLAGDDPADLHDGLTVTRDTIRFASNLDRFRAALTAWTVASSRYALAAPAEPAR